LVWHDHEVGDTYEKEQKRLFPKGLTSSLINTIEDEKNIEVSLLSSQQELLSNTNKSKDMEYAENIKAGSPTKLEIIPPKYSLESLIFIVKIIAIVILIATTEITSMLLEI